MSKMVKILMGLGCGVLILGVIFVVAVVIGLNYFESTTGESMKPFETEGIEFGKKNDQQGCVDEGLRRSRAGGILDFNAGMATLTFSESCLKNARPTQNFCVGVPSFWSMKDSEWKIDQCHKAGLDEQKTGCIHVFSAKHNHCSPPF